MSEITIDIPVTLHVSVTSKDGNDIEFFYEEVPEEDCINISINDYLSSPEEVEMIHELSAKGYYTPEQVSELSTREIKPLERIRGQLHTLSQTELKTLVNWTVDELINQNQIPF